MLILKNVHSFDVSFETAKKIQKELLGLVNISDSGLKPDDIGFVGGIDVSFIEPGLNRFQKKTVKCPAQKEKNTDNKTIALAGIVVYDVKKGNVAEKAFAVSEINFPYIPGFLSFREGPAVLKAMMELSRLPGVIIYDGCGIAHPRGLGIASHLSVLTGIPFIGCAKSLLCGICGEPGKLKGAWTEIIYKEKIVGCCLRTRNNVKPVYVSPGSGMSIKEARDFVLSLALKFRLPEPTRLAHNFVTEEKRNYLKNNSFL